MSLSRTTQRILTAFAALLAVGAGVSILRRIAPAPVVLAGTVDANQVLISSQAAGRVVKLLVEEGQDVRAGDVVALLDPAELAASLGSLKAQASSLESQVDAAREAAASSVGEARHGLASAQAALDMAKATLAEAAANGRKQQDLARRMLALAQAGAVSAQDRDDALRGREAAEAREQAARNGVTQAEAAVRSAEARTHQGVAARENVRSALGQLASARALAAGAETRLAYARVLAPSDGRIGILAVRQGEILAAGGAIATLVDLRQTWVLAAIPETRAGNLKVGDRLGVRMPSGSQVTGRVLVKAAEADFATQRDTGSSRRDIRAIRLKLGIDNPDGVFVPGMSADVIVPGRAR